MMSMLLSQDRNALKYSELFAPKKNEHKKTRRNEMETRTNRKKAYAEFTAVIMCLN